MIITLAVISIFLICMIILFFSIRGEVNSKYNHRIFTKDTVPAKDICLVLGAAVWGGVPSHILEDRLLVGIDLYKYKKVKKIILSGDHGQASYDEVNTMKQFMLSHGVNEHDIFLDHAGFRTYDSCYRARDIFGVKECIIVTNSFHLPRALYTAGELGIDAYGVPSDLRPYVSIQKYRFREFFAQYKAFLDIKILKPEPRFLGPKIDMNGSGLVTQD